MELKDIKGLGAKSIEKLAHLSIFSSNDLLLHLPFRYLDKTHFSSLQSIRPDMEVLLKLTITSVEVIGVGAKIQLICYLQDNNKQKFIWRFFNFSQFQRQQFVRGYEVECFGEVKISRLGLEMIHPEYRIISLNQPTLLNAKLTPVYFCTEGIAQNKLRNWILEALEDFNKNYPNCEFKKAINFLHYPQVGDDDLELILNFKHKMQQTLIVQEFAARKLLLLQAQKKLKSEITTSFKSTNLLLTKLKLNFNLTTAQQRVIAEIKDDLAKPKPMLRLLQGDVGCGKTIVAIIASLIVVESNFQVAVLTPTTILAKQHLENFEQLLTKIGVKIAFLISSQTKQERQKNLELISNGVDIIIGTNAIFQDDVIYQNLGLIIIDEQHKFGVEQRLKLSKKAKSTPHTLTMSATPIPRSIVMTAYGQMDISIIDELPKNRIAIKTIVVGVDKKPQILTKIKQVCAQNQQVYWVCVLIEDSENFNATSSESSFEWLKQNLVELKIALVHSKISKEEKQQIMHDFKIGKIDILVATTVIEVGVNVPSATLMVVENSEKLGLASLHQLRGRVGRGSDASLCILMYSGKLSVNAKERLKILRQTNDGFLIAKKDLELRGAGEILGVNQSGLANFKIANLVRDEYLLDKANALAYKYFKTNINTQNEFLQRWVNFENKNLVKA